MADTRLMDSSPLSPHIIIRSVFVCTALLPYALSNGPVRTSPAPVVIRLERVQPSLSRPQRPSFHLAVGPPRQRSHPPIGVDKVDRMIDMSDFSDILIPS
jgi:hypothetical protein